MPDEKPTAPNLSGIRDRAIKDFTANLTQLAADQENYIQLDGLERFQDIETAPDFAGTRLLIAREATPRIDIAAATIKNPVIVFRDFLTEDGLASRTYALHYVGLMRLNDMSVSLTYVFTHRNVVIKAISKPLDKSVKILGLIDGIPILRKRPEITVV